MSLLDRPAALPLRPGVAAVDDELWRAWWRGVFAEVRRLRADEAARRAARRLTVVCATGGHGDEPVLETYATPRGLLVAASRLRTSTIPTPDGRVWRPARPFTATSWLHRPDAVDRCLAPPGSATCGKCRREYDFDDGWIAAESATRRRRVANSHPAAAL
ncbi:MAG: hypothetical protein IRZ04_21830 [Rhodospirillales bacterium]|nr:hypothetical protein [Rhodospirillales bacterium]